MADIIDINEAWAGHSGLEVERFVKNQMTRILAASEGKYGASAFNPQTMTITFYDQPGGTPLGNIQLGGDIYTITPNCNLPQIFYILADESSKMMTIAPTTSKSSFGSSESQPFPEGYSYVVAVNSGSGYIDRIGPEVIQPNGSATFDISRRRMANSRQMPTPNSTADSPTDAPSVTKSGMSCFICSASR